MTENSEERKVVYMASLGSSTENDVCGLREDIGLEGLVLGVVKHAPSLLKHICSLEDERRCGEG